MADTKISALATLTDPVVGDFIPIVDTSDVETKKIDISGIDAYYNANHYGIVDDNSTDNLANLNTLSTTINAVGGGVLYLPFTDTGIYRVDATAGVLLRENVTLMMDPGVKIVNVSNASGSTNSTVRVSPGASIINAEFEHLSTSTTWSGAEIMLQTSQVGKWLRTDRTVLDNIKIQGVPNGLYDGFGSGIYLRSDVLNTAIQWCKFSNIWFNQVASCFEMRVSAGTSGNPSFINGNIFENIYTSNVSYVFLMAGQATYSNINENIVQNVFHQSSSPGSFKVIYCEGRLNTFRNIVTFDWEAVVGTTSMFQFTATADGNYVEHPNAKNWMMVDATVGSNALKNYNNAEGLQNPLAVSGLGGHMAANVNNTRIVYVTNGDAGSPCLAVSDGTNWLRVALGAAVSAT